MIFGVVATLCASVPAGEAAVPLIADRDRMLRCCRCRAYINAFSAFSDGGRKWICNLCGVSNDVPSAVLAGLDGSGKPHNVTTRPELRLGTVDYVDFPEEDAASSSARETTASSVSEKYDMPHVVFVVENTSHASLLGLRQPFLAALKQLNGLRCRVAFVGFSGRQIQFVCTPSSSSASSQPQIHVVTDLDDPFLPMPAESSFFDNPSDLLSSLEGIVDFSSTSSSSPEGACTGSALRCAELLLEATKSFHRGCGRVILLMSSAPHFGLGALLDDKTPKANFSWWSSFADRSCRSGISVDVHLCSIQSIRLPYLMCISSSTGGSIFDYYPYERRRSEQRLISSIVMGLSTPFCHDVLWKVRTSQGIVPLEYWLPYPAAPIKTDPDPLGGIPSTYTVGVLLGFDGSSIPPAAEPCIQVAVAFTPSAPIPDAPPTCRRRPRIIRVHTISMGVSSSAPTLFRSADEEAMSYMAIRRSLFAAKSGDKISPYSLSPAITSVDGLESVGITGPQSAMNDFLVRMLLSYRLKCASDPEPGQLILPESMKVLPLHLLAVAKSAVFFSGRANPGSTVDDSAHIFAYSLTSSALDRFVNMIYPRLIELSPAIDAEGKTSLNHRMLPLSSASISFLSSTAAYLLYEGRTVWILIPRTSSFAYSDEFHDAVRDAAVRILALYLPNSAAVLTAEGKCEPPVLSVVREGEVMATAFLNRLVEDRIGGTMSYAEFLVFLHRQVMERSQVSQGSVAPDMSMLHM